MTSPASAPHTVPELCGRVLGSESYDSPHPVCTAGGGWEGLQGLLPTQGCLQWRWGGALYTAGARKNRSLLPNPAPPLKHRAELLLEAGLRRWVQKNIPAGASEGHPGEETGRLTGSEAQHTGMCLGSLGCRWGKG